MIIDGGPTKTLSDELEVDAVDSLSITLPANTSEKKIEVQPGEMADVKLLYIKSDVHEGIKYTLNDDPPEPGGDVPTEPGGDVPIVLDTDHILNSSKIVESIGTNPRTIKFTNDSAIDANIEILVARSASS